MEVIYNVLRSERNTEIPVTIVNAGKENGPLVLMAHGFKANRTEDGRFLEVAEALAKDGVSSIMPGFPGCDESKDDFINYTLDNCLSDLETCYAYMKENGFENSTKIGMIGYSMGGRLTSLFIQRHPEIKVIALWAGACYDGFNGEDTFLGESLAKMKQECAEKGYCDFYNSFDGTYLKLNQKLIQNMEDYKPSSGLENFKGAALVVHGDADITVPYSVGKRTYAMLDKAAERKLVTVHEADHGFGAWNKRKNLSLQLTSATEMCFRNWLLK